MSFHIHFVRFISDARLLLLKPPAAGKFVNINIYTADRHWLGRWQPQQCKRRPPPHLLLGPGDATLLCHGPHLTHSRNLCRRISCCACVCVCLYLCACQRLILYLISRYSFLFFVVIVVPLSLSGLLS